MAATGGHGADVVLDCIGGSYWEANAAAAAPDARWVQYGLMGGPDVHGPLLAAVLRKRLALLGTTLRPRPVAYKAALVAAFTAQAWPALAAGGALRTQVDATFPFADAAAAHELVERNTTKGKVLLVVDAALAEFRNE